MLTHLYKPVLIYALRFSKLFIISDGHDEISKLCSSTVSETMQTADFTN
jgi:hypothetical protein